jgi:prephenate dehydratase
MTNLHKIVGIQGGAGSFNEQAALMHLKNSGVPDFELIYLRTTEKVIQSLEHGNIDYGQFAIHNTLGGDVQESKRAIAGYKLDIVAQYKFRIGHVLMISKEAQLSDIDTIMTHPQVLIQCRKKLKEQFSHLKLTSGQGELIDPAMVAEQIATKKLPKNIAVASSAAIAKINGLKIVADNLQDADDNYTTFLLVKHAVKENGAASTGIYVTYA